MYYSSFNLLYNVFCISIQCVLYLIAPYIALQLCSINRRLVGEIFIIFLILFVGLSLFITLKNSYNIFLKNYNFLEKYTSLCYTTSILTYGENT